MGSAKRCGHHPLAPDPGLKRRPTVERCHPPKTGPGELTAMSVRPVPFLSGLVLPCLLAGLLTWVFVATGAELALQRSIYRAGEGWVFADHPIVLALYRWGPKPALLAGVASLSFLLASTFRRAWRGHWRSALFLPLVLLLGPGLLVNSVFKAHWGRPRPRQVVEFGGTVDYRAPWQPTTPLNRNGSFPSGHASMGFVLGAPVFLYRRRRPMLAALFLAAGLIGGFAVGAGRVLQGGHFPTDVLWAGVLVYVAAWTTHRLLLPRSVTAHAVSCTDAPTSPTGHACRSLAHARTHATQRTLSVVIPFFNEQDNVIPVLEETRVACPHAEIIAVDDGIRDTGCTLKAILRDHVRFLVPFHGMHRFMPALLRNAGLSLVEVPVSHRPRLRGGSKYSISGRARRGIFDLIGVAWLLSRQLCFPREITVVSPKP